MDEYGALQILVGVQAVLIGSGQSISNDVHYISYTATVFQFTIQIFPGSPSACKSIYPS